ncbi:hypothetical protein [uncultured Olegusella sp.]|uniref:hypothetical protein n=1 Tax=uncultured Olegusella sp. TaxID=1979846 RepID=UPI0026046075|nr:hypothetical protein [uncultured Olegusella sp.]
MEVRYVWRYPAILLSALCLFHSDKIAFWIYSSYTEGVSDFELLKLCMSIQLLFAIMLLSLLATLVVDYAHAVWNGKSD